MKKYRLRVLSFILTALLAAGAVTGCGAKNEPQTLDTIDPTAYITLGEYKGLEIDGADTTVSDGDVEANINSTLESHSEQKEVTDRAAKLGDTVNIDYLGTENGVAFDGGTGNYDLKLGSGSFIPGFEDGVVGMKIGETKDLDLTFPENYQSEELAGKAVVFTVTVNSISEEVVPELTDEFVQSLDNDAQTVDEYRAYVKDMLTEQNESTAKANIEAELLDKVVKNTEGDVDKLPEWLVSENVAEYKNSIQSYISSYGMTLSDYLTSTGTDEETFNEQAEEYGREIAKSKLVVAAIANAENLSVDADEIEDYYTEYAGNYNTTVDNVKNAIPEDELKNYLLQQKVMDLLYDNALITETTVD